jgi:hypothetical protein
MVLHLKNISIETFIVLKIIFLIYIIFSTHFWGFAPVAWVRIEDEERKGGEKGETPKCPGW